MILLLSFAFHVSKSNESCGRPHLNMDESEFNLDDNGTFFLFCGGHEENESGRLTCFFYSVQRLTRRPTLWETFDTCECAGENLHLVFDHLVWLFDETSIICSSSPGCSGYGSRWCWSRSQLPVGRRRGQTHTRLTLTSEGLINPSRLFGGGRKLEERITQTQDTFHDIYIDLPLLIRSYTVTKFKCLLLSTSTSCPDPSQHQDISGLTLYIYIFFFPCKINKRICTSGISQHHKAPVRFTASFFFSFFFFHSWKVFTSSLHKICTLTLGQRIAVLDRRKRLARADFLSSAAETLSCSQTFFSLKCSIPPVIIYLGFHLSRT